MGEIFANPLTELAEYGDMKQDLMKGKVTRPDLRRTDSQKVHVMYQVSEEKAWRLVVTHDDTRARELYDDFSYFEKTYMAVSRQGSSVLQLRYPWKPSDQTADAGV